MKKILILFTDSHQTKWGETIISQTPIDIQNILKYRYDVSIYKFTGFSNELLLKVKSVDLVFNICYGFYKENQIDISQVDVVKWLDDNNIKHTVSKYEASKLAMDKTCYPILIQDIDGINSPKDISFLNDNTTIIRKYKSGACHKDIAIYNSKSEIKIEEIFLYQEYIKGREFSVGVISTNDIVIIKPYEIYSDDDVFLFGYRTKVNIDPIIEQSVLDNIYNTIYELHKRYNFIGITRTDLKLDIKNNLYLLDINSMPNIDKQLTIIPRVLELHGISYDKMINDIVEYFI